MEQSVWTAIFTECNGNKYACCDVNKWAFIAQSSQSLLVKRASIKPDRWEVQLKINTVWILNGIKVQQSTVTVRCVGRTNCNCIQAENVGAVVKKESRAWGSIYATREFAEFFFTPTTDEESGQTTGWTPGSPSLEIYDLSYTSTFLTVDPWCCDKTTHQNWSGDLDLLSGSPELGLTNNAVYKTGPESVWLLWPTLYKPDGCQIFAPQSP